jgi:hypothetical protein
MSAITQERFSGLPLSASLQRALSEVLKYEFMTKVIVITLAMRYILLCACSVPTSLE